MTHIRHHHLCKTKPCNCGDQGLHTQTPCNQNTPDCPDPEQCAETFSGECIRYTGDTIVDANIEYGDNFNEIVQKLTLLVLNPSCWPPVTGGCDSVINLMSVAITTTSITVKWDAAASAAFYDLEYKLASSGTWIVTAAIPLATFPSQTITGLLPNTDYTIRIANNCSNSGICYSLTILVRTKP